MSQKSQMVPNAHSVPIMIDAESVRRMLVAAIGTIGSQRAFAERHRMSAEYLSEVARGTRDPGPAVLDTLGLERVVGYRRRAP